VFSQALNTKGMMLMNRGRYSEAAVLLRASLDVALENELSRAAMRGYNNLTVCLVGGDRLEDTIELDRAALELARKVGDRQWELNFIVGALQPMVLNGRWDEAIAQRDLTHSMVDPEQAAEPWIATEVAWTTGIELARGNVEAAAALVPDTVLHHEQHEIEATMAAMRAAVFNAEGRHQAALELVREQALDVQLPPQSWAFKLTWYEAMAAALNLDIELARGLLARAHSIRRGRLTPFLRAQIARYDAVFAARDGALGRAEAGYKAAAGILREGAMPFHLGVCLTEFGEWYRAAGREGDAAEAFNEARAIFARLGATPWLERAGGVSVPAAPAAGSEAVPS